MEQFVGSLDSLKSYSPFNELVQNLELVSHFEQVNGSILESFNLGLVGFSNDNFLPFFDNFPHTSTIQHPKLEIDPDLVASVGEQEGDRKRKIGVLSETNSMKSSSITAETKNKKKCMYFIMRKSSSKDQVEDPKKVVHVRARRGEATDSHSLAERVRREKINERMRCIQELVAGCYKMMDMAGMLDEIINYVQSLQNQVEFLSMKLSAASSFYDFSLGMEAMTAQQDGYAAYAYLQARYVERLGRK